MERFPSIEGARAWLAWAVVFSHIAIVSGITNNPILMGGSTAVVCFMILSGFVITHMLESRPEPYAAYLTRRFFRLYPLFVLACVIGFFTNDLEAYVMSKAWYSSLYYADGASYPFAEVARSNHDYFLAHVVAHGTMLHGAISDTILPFSSSAFNAAAWSISLEWQFYLVAPFVLLLCRKENWAPVVAGIGVAAWVAYRHGWFGSFMQPSLLPAAAGYFAVGIASRLAYPRLAKSGLRLGGIVALAIIILPLLGPKNLPLLFWLVLFGGLVSVPDGPSQRLYRLCFDSRLAQYLGTRSYSTYLVHMPLVAVAHWAAFSLIGLGSPSWNFALLCLMVIPATLLLSEATYRFVEVPGIRFGTGLLRRRAKRAAGIASA